MPTQSYPPGTVLMRPMMDDLARNWGFIFLRGLAAIVFGVLTFAWPGLTLVSLVLLYGVFAIFDGVFAIGAAIRGGQAAPRWWLALLGVLGLAAGVVTLAWPGLTGLLLLYFIAGWAIVSGVLQIIGAIRLRKEIEGEWLLIASGVLSVLFGVFVVANPGAGALGLAFAIGTFAVIYGVLLIGFALRLRSHARVRI